MLLLLNGCQLNDNYLHEVFPIKSPWYLKPCLLTDLTDIDETAQAKVGAETWTVKSDKAPLLKGTKVKVLAIEGVKLVVEPVTE